MSPTTFEPMIDCGPVVVCDGGGIDGVRSTSVPPQVIVPAKNPWAAALDQSVNQDASKPLLDRLALGKSITQTPEYAAANLPPYNQSGGGILNLFLF